MRAVCCLLEPLPLDTDVESLKVMHTSNCESSTPKYSSQIPLVHKGTDGIEKYLTYSKWRKKRIKLAMNIKKRNVRK